MYFYKAGDAGSEYISWDGGNSGNDKFYAEVILGIPKDAA